MNMRKTWTLLAAIGTGLCLAAALGCGGKTRYNVPDMVGFSPQQGAVGSNVTITGYDFNDIYSVSFGGQATEGFKVSNGSQTITVTVPATAATGPLVVENPAGIGTNYISFIVTPSINEVTIPGIGTIPQIANGMSPTSGPVGTEITLTGYGLNDTSNVTINPANEITVNVSPGAVTGPVVLTVPGLTPSAPLTATGPVFTVTP
jgi:hypothetical protein